MERLDFLPPLENWEENYYIRHSLQTRKIANMSPKISRSFQDGSLVVDTIYRRIAASSVQTLPKN